MKILVKINSGFRRLLIEVDDSKNIFVVNRKKTNFDIDTFIFKMCDITMDWPASLSSNDGVIFDSAKVDIVIENADKCKVMKYAGELPDDFYNLEVLIEEVLERVEKNKRFTL